MPAAICYLTIYADPFIAGGHRTLTAPAYFYNVVLPKALVAAALEVDGTGFQWETETVVTLVPCYAQGHNTKDVRIYVDNGRRFDTNAEEAQRCARWREIVDHILTTFLEDNGLNLTYDLEFHPTVDVGIGRDINGQVEARWGGPGE